MKKILFILSSLACGGTETALLDLCSLLNKEQYEVTILEYYGYNNLLKPQFLDAGIRVISPYYQLTQGKNLLHKCFNVIKQKQITSRLYKHNKIVLSEKFDIYIYYQPTIVRVLGPDKPVTVTYIHGDVATNTFFGKHITNLKPRILESDKIVCVSNLAKESLAKVTGISKNTVAIFNPINSNKILSLSEATITEKLSKPYICAVGRLSPEKRFDSLVRIHRNLLDRGLPHDLVIVGEGDERTKIETVIQETGTANSVHLLGFKENPYPYMKNSLFTVCSSDTEGLPVISMESLLLEKPIVSSFPTVGELFGDEECGLITQVDLKSLEDGIYKMLADQEFYQRCVMGAKTRSAFFDSKKMVMQVETMLDEVLSTNSP